MKTHWMRKTEYPTQFALSFAFLLIVLLAVSTIAGQQLQKGISVQLAKTQNAKPVPAADETDAWIISVNQDGQLWFGIKSVDKNGLMDEMIRTPRRRDQALYIKADARAHYRDVRYVLKAARTAGFEAPVLLTAQPASPQPGEMVPPEGLEVWFPSSAMTAAESATLEVISATDSASALRLNERAIEWKDLGQALDQLFQGQSEKAIEVTGSGQLPFAQIAHAIDACRSSGAKVVLAIPEI